jgi:hypothetical protein
VLTLTSLAVTDKWGSFAFSVIFRSHTIARYDLYFTMAAFALRTANQWLESQLASGPWEILALTFLASAVVVPITQYRTLYGFTVGYGASVGWMGSYLLWLVLRTPSPFPSSEWSSPSRILVVSAIVYGFRLAIYLLLRDLGGWKPRGTYMNDTSRWRRVPFALLLSSLYGCMVSPIVYAIRHPLTSSFGGGTSRVGSRNLHGRRLDGGGRRRSGGGGRRAQVLVQEPERGSAPG